MMAKLTKEDLLRRVWTEPTTGCWLWSMALDSRGYGWVRFNGRPTRAHRAAWVLFRGEIPSGLEIDHLCRVHSCVNPVHLDLVTHAENVRRGLLPQIVAARGANSHCKNGHEYTETNTYRFVRDGTPRRQCRKCSAEKTRRFRERKENEN